MRFIYFIGVILFLSLNLRPSITSVGPLLEVIQTDLNMSGVTASLITTLPVFCMGVFALVSIQLSNRLGVEKSLLAAMVLIFMATISRAVLNSSLLLLVSALIAGVGIGISSPLISGFIKKHFPDKPSVTSVFSVSMVIGAAMATTFSVPLFKLLNESWQLSLSAWGLLALIASLMLLPLLRYGNTTAATMMIPSLRITNKRVYLYTLFFGCMAAVFYSITAWLAPYAQSIGMSGPDSGYMLTLFTAIQIPVSFLMPVLAGKIGSRKMWLLLCAVSELIGIVMLLGNLSPWIAAIFLGIGAGGLFPLALLIPIEEASSAEEATSWSAQMQCGGFIIAALGPLVFGLTLDVASSYTPAFIVILITIITMMVTIIKMEKKRIE